MHRCTEISGIVLAAGHSSRMGENKLLMPWGEQCVVRSVVHKVCGLGLAEVVVVTGHQGAQVQEHLDGYPVRTVHNPDFAKGMASSIRAGVERVGGKGYLLVLGDMPKVGEETMGIVAGALDRDAAIVVPVMDGRRGHPVAFGSAYREELLHLEGDRGARSIVGKYRDRVIEVEVDDPGVFVDVDTPEAYRAALRK